MFFWHTVPLIGIYCSADLQRVSDASVFGIVLFLSALDLAWSVQYSNMKQRTRFRQKYFTFKLFFHRENMQGLWIKSHSLSKFSAYGFR